MFLLDFLSLGLALSSGVLFWRSHFCFGPAPRFLSAAGVLFGGVLPGAFLSATGATLGSSLSFGLSRGQLKQRVDGALAKQPVARGLAKAPA